MCPLCTLHLPRFGSHPVAHEKPGPYQASFSAEFLDSHEFPHEKMKQLKCMLLTLYMISNMTTIPEVVLTCDE